MSKIEALILDEVVADSGSRQEGFINVARSPNGSWVRIPVIIIRGSAAGPVLLADACTHGDEYEGAEAVIKVAQALDPKALKGTFVGVPALNYDAFCANSRVSPLDGTNLNRIFPGNPNLFISHRLANTYMERVIKQADYLISFHGGGNVLHLEPIVGYRPPADSVGKTAQKLARAFGAPTIWRMQNLPFDGVSALEAGKLGVPAILPEIGSHCTRHYDRERYVNMCATGIQNVMKALGMLEGNVPETPGQIDAELHYIHCSAGGIHIPVKKAKERVKAGETLAVITDVFGHQTAEVTAPFDGFVVGYWSVPVINPGDWSYLYGKILD